MATNPVLAKDGIWTHEDALVALDWETEQGRLAEENLLELLECSPVAARLACALGSDDRYQRELTNTAIPPTSTPCSYFLVMCSISNVPQVAVLVPKTK